MRLASSILPRSSRFLKMFRAGGQVPVHTVAPDSARALAMANPYPPSSASPATSARLPWRSMLSTSPLPNCGLRIWDCGLCMQAFQSAIRNRQSAITRESAIANPQSHEEPRRHRNELRVPDQRVREDPAERALPQGDRVDRARQGVEAGVVELLERVLEAVVLQVILAEQVHPCAVVG